jgi:hypothetical protein
MLVIEALSCHRGSKLCNNVDLKNSYSVRNTCPSRIGIALNLTACVRENVGKRIFLLCLPLPLEVDAARVKVVATCDNIYQ